MKIYEGILNTISQRGAAYFILIDPDKYNEKKLSAFARYCEESGADGFLVGGSILLDNNVDHCINTLKNNTSLPVIIFPGNVNQVHPSADAVLFLSVISGRNSEDLIGKHVTAAPVIKNLGVEPISTGYMLIESGRYTTVQYLSGSFPIPSDKPDMAVATALAGEYLGMKFIYLEAGSGAQYPVPDQVVKAVSSNCTIPVIVGGGIKNPSVARAKVLNGAKIIVTGNYFEDEDNWYLIKEFAQAVHLNQPIEV